MRLTSDEHEQRVKWSVQNWKDMVFVTATLREQTPDPSLISTRWTAFIKALKRSHFADLRSVRVLQEHAGGHGWHIHALIDRYVPLSISKRLEAEAGLGRTRWDWISNDQRDRCIRYLIRYICRDMKHRRKRPELKHVRLLTASGSLSSKDKGGRNSQRERWWRRYRDLVVVDSANEFRQALQRRLEIVGNAHLKFRTHRGRSIPMRTTDLLMIATHEDIEWARRDSAERTERLLMLRS
jgi:hypothetical protein